MRRRPARRRTPHINFVILGFLPVGVKRRSRYQSKALGELIKASNSSRTKLRTLSFFFGYRYPRRAALRTCGAWLACNTSAAGAYCTYRYGERRFEYTCVTFDTSAR